ncbi:class I SAM-dependent methyltransferase [Dyadobacter sandarakinus]|uniref:Class I SAM-dependent methyltransferase n=1 Tax=Dyadobacter sandarakinus TaxID=2747268 RepID=A0ABX7I9T9_9BACT|nr:class I SAM-dependent methyltransferase [Dyadobacter sandarakinus]QRR02882.1 class I SAM-dependent methyltransferase [Dyadobacter sandarakinus]
MTTFLDNARLYLGVLKRVGRTMTLGLFGSNNRQELLALYNIYETKTNGKESTPVDPFIIPKTDIFELLGNDSAVYEGVYECGFGHTTEFELKVISNLVKKLNPNRVFEIGTFQGRTTLNIALNCHPDAIITTLDLPSSELDSTKMEIEEGEIRYVTKDISGERFIGHPIAYKIKQVFGDSATFPFEEYTNSIDLAFIDGSHAYDYVLNDSEKVFNIMRPGGLIMWHDYTNWPGVWSALNKLYQSDIRYVNIKHIGGTSIAMLKV